MRFVHPWLLLASIPVLIIGITLFFVLQKRKKRLLTELLGPRADDPEACSLARGRRLSKFILLMLGILLLIFAASRPYFRFVELPAEIRSRDIMIIFDVSKSMRAGDLPPSRLEHAKYLLREVLKAFPEDRFGLIPFAGNAYLSCPLTLDHHALNMAIDDLDYSSVPVGGTNLSRAFAAAERAFSGSAGENRAVLLLTDGDQLSGDAAEELADLKKMHIPVIAVGFGSTDAAVPVPGDNGGVMYSASGEPAGSRLNEELLRQIAAETGGVYIRSSIDRNGEDEIRKFLESRSTDAVVAENQRIPEDIFPWFVLGAFIMLSAAGVISECKKNVISIVVAFGCIIIASARTPAEIYRKARDLQIAGDPQAAELYEKLSAMPDTPEILRGRALQNLAVISHIQGREKVTAAEKFLTEQNLDGALKEVEQAQKDFRRGQELYSGALTFSERNEFDRQRAENFQHLLLDQTAVEKLKKQIEELKKQQQQAQKQTEDAQKQNQENRQNKENNSEKQQQASEQTDAARKAAEELAGKAEELKQKKLAEDARDAAEKLKDAEQMQNENKWDEAGKKLDEAQKKLSGGSEKQEKNGEEREKNDKDNDPQKNGNDEKADNARRAVDLLNDETGELRKAIRQQRKIRRAPVEKDW